MKLCKYNCVLIICIFNSTYGDTTRLSVLHLEEKTLIDICMKSGLDV